ncbi:MAG: hypothetical protein Q9224_001733 [Gallowayella concinna]
MRRSSMRRGSAVLLSILPLLTPTYALPTYFGNEAAVSHMNVERAAIPEPVVTLAPQHDIPVDSDVGDSISNIASEGAGNWLRKIGRRGEEKRQLSSTISPTNLEVEDATPSLSGGAAYAPRGGRNVAPANVGSAFLPSQRLGTAKREIEAREASAEAKPRVTLDMDYVPPAETLAMPPMAFPQ